MHALVFHEVKQPLRWETRPELEPGPDQAVIQLETAALNRRDYWITQGMYPGLRPGVVLGSDGAGRVGRIGAKLDAAWLQREVIINPGLDWGKSEEAQSSAFHILGMPTDGTFATEVVVPGSYLHRRPAHLSWAEAAALPLAGVTAYRALFIQGGLQTGEKVLITGIGGGVATLALQFAVAAGAQAWVTSSSPEKIEQAKLLGALGGIDYKQEGWAKTLLKEIGPVDVIIDSAGGAGYGSLLELAAPGGKIVNYGATAGPPGKVDMFKLFWKQLRLIGSTMGSPADFAAMLAFVNQHQIKPIVDETIPLKEGAAAVAKMESSPQFGKIVLNCR